MPNNKKYQPITEWKLRVGGRVTDERMEKLVNFDFVGLDDITTDDLFAVNSLTTKKMLYAMYGVAEQLWGEEKTMEYAETAGRTMYNRNWALIQQRFGTLELSPEQIAWYQDMAHLFYGPCTEAYTEYDDEKCVVTREKCIMKATKELAHLRKYDEAMCNGVLKGYMDRQPNLECERVCSYGGPEDLVIKVDLDKMGYQGGTLCQHIWRVKK